MEPNLQSKPRLGEGRADLRRKIKTPVQIKPQIQTSGVDQVKEQTLPKQKEVVQPPLTKVDCRQIHRTYARNLHNT